MLEVLMLFLIAPLTYEEAYEQSKTTHNLVVLIEMENCPACVVQERNLDEVEIKYCKTRDISRWPKLPTLRPLTLWYWREGKEWRMELLKGSIDSRRLRAIKEQRTRTTPE